MWLTALRASDRGRQVGVLKVPQATPVFGGATAPLTNSRRTVFERELRGFFEGRRQLPGLRIDIDRPRKIMMTTPDAGSVTTM